jgi:hypothetical protein
VILDCSHPLSAEAGMLEQNRILLDQELRELIILDRFFRLLGRNNIEWAEDFDISLYAKGSSYEFYQTIEVFRFHRLNDFKEIVCLNALNYLKLIKGHLINNPEVFAHLLRKNAVILSRKQKEQAHRLL